MLQPNRNNIDRKYGRRFGRRFRQRFFRRMAPPHADVRFVRFVRPRDHAMKPVTIDMLRAHLMAASLTAMGTQVLALLALLVMPVSSQVFSSTSFRILALTLIASGVVLMRQFAQAAFNVAFRNRHATHAGRSVLIGADCPWRWFVVLHLRFTGRPFVLARP
jgi:hypothetical protein